MYLQMSQIFNIQLENVALLMSEACKRNKGFKIAVLKVKYGNQQQNTTKTLNCCTENKTEMLMFRDYQSHTSVLQ